MAVLSEIGPRLREIREDCQKVASFSWTSEKYQIDILSFIADHQDRGFGVIEVGCYRGGLSCLLAELCRALDWPFYTMDIDLAATEITSTMLARFGLDRLSTVFLGDLRTFARKIDLSLTPTLIVLDGDHRYEAVVDDIRSTYSLNQRPYAAAFHDYSLRHPTTNERVNDAVADNFGVDIAVRHIGVQMVGDGTQPTKENPHADGHYWQVPGSEGAIVVLPDKIRP
jgi:hypothetical protein